MQLTDDAAAGPLLPLAGALARIADRFRPVTGIGEVDLAAARGRILARDCIAPRAVPPHPNAAVDGYALYFDDLSSAGPTRLTVVGRAAAGHGFPRPVPRGAAVRIFTGAPIPAGPGGTAGPDTVAMQEDCERQGGHIVVPPGLGRGANWRAAGEDTVAGARILAAGRVLRPEDVGMAAAAGFGRLPVRHRLRVGVFSTGDELREPGSPGGPDSGSGAAIYDANRHALLALVADFGCDGADLGILRDNPAVLRPALRAAAAGCDLLVTSGGASVGEEDHLAATVAALGGIDFWKVGIKPGRPVLTGRVGATPLLGLPGNPAAMMVTMLILGRPMILRLAGARPPPLCRLRVPAGFHHRKKPARREFLRVSRGPDRRLLKFPRAGAGILMSFVESDGLVELPEDCEAVQPGDMVDFIPREAFR